MDVHCKGRRAVVTAGGSGIGKTIAEVMAANGAQVFICDIVEDGVREVAEANDAVNGIAADVAKADDVDRLFDEATKAMGGVDVLINNAGVAGPTARVENITPDEWDRTLAVDISGQFYCARRAVPLMKANGKGTIVNISSTAGRLVFPLRLPYATSKRAILGFTETLAMELGPANINVNTILPGYMLNQRAINVLTAKAEAAGVTYDEMQKIILQRISMRTGITEQEVAELAVYLCSEQGRHISSQHISLDGNLETYAGMDKLDE